MPRKKKNVPPKPRTHLTLDDRIAIEKGLDHRKSISEIARELGKDRSTISREIQRNCTIKEQKGVLCEHYWNCKKNDLCPRKCGPRKHCSRCKMIKCSNTCPDYKKSADRCLRRKEKEVCNGCPCLKDPVYCFFTQRIYRAVKADNASSERSLAARGGFNLTGEQFARIDKIVSPLLQKGLSPYAILSKHKDLGISIQTLYRLVECGELSAGNLDLRNQVKRKPRKGLKTRKMRNEVVSKLKEGRKFSNFKEYMATNSVPVVQMDTVLGLQAEKPCLLTLHLPSVHLQLALILEEHTSTCVVHALDVLEETLGTELFESVFPVILTDNGTEFTDITGMERSFLIPDHQRTKIFFCDPNRSDQKGACENNHRFIRYVIPKGTSLMPYSQEDINLMMNHINSYPRKELYGKTPLQAARILLPEDVFILLGLEEIPHDELFLKPALLWKGKEQNSISQS